MSCLRETYPRQEYELVFVTLFGGLEAKDITAIYKTYKPSIAQTINKNMNRKKPFQIRIVPTLLV